MIELPRAACAPARSRKTAEFFSFGTNDLTQTTLRHLARRRLRFLKTYEEKGISRRTRSSRSTATASANWSASAANAAGRRAAPQARHLRRARRRPGLDLFLRGSRARLQQRACVTLPKPTSPVMASTPMSSGNWWSSREPTPPTASGSNSSISRHARSPLIPAKAGIPAFAGDAVTNACSPMPAPPTPSSSGSTRGSFFLATSPPPDRMQDPRVKPEDDSVNVRDWGMERFPTPRTAKKHPAQIQRPSQKP
jgi:hypothetical protein